MGTEPENECDGNLTAAVMRVASVSVLVLAAENDIISFVCDLTLQRNLFNIKPEN